MPVVAVIGGVVSAMGAASGAAALLGGAFTVANVAAGLTFVGGVASALGGVTGNKKLMKFGMIAGLGGAAVGGLGSMMSATTNSPYSLASGAEGGLGLKAPTVGADVGGLSAGGSGLGLSAGPSAGGGYMTEAFKDVGAGGGMLGAPPSAMGAAPSVAAPSYELAPPAPSAMPPPPTSNVGTSAKDILAGAGGQNASGVIDQATSALGGFGKMLTGKPELTKVGLGMLSSMSAAKAEEGKLAAAKAQADEQRLRYERSILGQRQAY